MGLTMAQTTGKSAREASLERRRALATTGKAALKGGVVASTGTSKTKKVNTVVVNTPMQASSMTGRDASRARRDAMSSSGKAGLAETDRIRTVPTAKASSASAKQQVSVKQDKSTDEKSTNEKSTKGCGCGCNGTQATCDVKPGTSVSANKSHIIANKKKQVIPRSAARIASLARRAATSSRGKAGINSSGFSAAQTARATNPDLSSRELAAAIRDSRSRSGKSGQKNTEPCGRRKSKSGGAAKDAPWKVGKSETVLGQTLTGTMVGRSQSVTGDEASTCRNVTGTEYMGADVFREFCQADSVPTTVRKVNVKTTAHGNSVSADRDSRHTNEKNIEAVTLNRVNCN